MWIVLQDQQLEQAIAQIVANTCVRGVMSEVGLLVGIVQKIEKLLATALRIGRVAPVAGANRASPSVRGVGGRVGVIATDVGRVTPSLRSITLA